MHSRALAGVTFLFAAAHAGQFASRTDLVIVPVTVTDSARAPVTHLTRENFRLFDGGEERPIALFVNGETAMTVELIVDQSQSMGAYRPALANAITALGEAMHDGDQIGLLTFNEQVESHSFGSADFTDDAAELRARIERTMPAGTTALRDAVTAGLSRVAQGAWPRKAIIIISDGGDTSSRTTERVMLHAARTSGASIYAIDLWSEAPRAKRPSTLDKIVAAAAAGRVFRADAASMASIMSVIVHDLRSQYILGFVPKPGQHQSRLRVTATSVGGQPLRVSGRSTY